MPDPRLRLGSNPLDVSKAIAAGWRVVERRSLCPVDPLYCNNKDPHVCQNLDSGECGVVVSGVPPRALDVNGQPTRWTQEQLDEMIEALESTGRYDVVGRRW